MSTICSIEHKYDPNMTFHNRITKTSLDKNDITWVCKWIYQAKQAIIIIIIFNLKKVFERGNHISLGVIKGAL